VDAARDDIATGNRTTFAKSFKNPAGCNWLLWGWISDGRSQAKERGGSRALLFSTVTTFRPSTTSGTRPVRTTHHRRPGPLTQGEYFEVSWFRFGVDGPALTNAKISKNSKGKDATWTVSYTLSEQRLENLF
jgi:hypothetical protein